MKLLNARDVASFVIAVGCMPAVLMAQTEALVFGPQMYTRQAGQPQNFIEIFSLASVDSIVHLRILNGDENGDHRLSSSTVLVNGVVRVHNEDLNQQVAELIVPLTGDLVLENTIEIRLTSVPDGFLIIEVTVELVPPMLNPHTEMTNVSPVLVTGSSSAATVEVSSPEGVFEVPVTNGEFSADVPLSPNRVNQIFFTGITGGVRSAPSTTSITHDAQPPNLFIDFPADGAEITTATTAVAGRVGDVLSGFMGLTVTVNGLAAVVDVGIGNNGTFFLPSLPLTQEAPTVITAEGRDELGNTIQKQITVTKIEIPPSAPRMSVVSGNGQTGTVNVVLPEPICGIGVAR